ncbi:hypothetical protein TNCV_4838401 [Trichonephila clavipes]|nr:hypothetical protein TNCV_4838401 [Trichonephila clavipes]
MDQTFSIGERSGERAGQDNSRIFSVSSKVRTIPSKCDRALSCLNTGFRRARIKGRTMGRNKPEMLRDLFKVPSMRAKGEQDVDSFAPHTSCQIMGQYEDDECKLPMCVQRDGAKHGCGHLDAVNRTGIHLKKMTFRHSCTLVRR